MLSKVVAKKLNTVRINAGEWRSRLLKFPEAEGLRPTPERVRQTVFNWLGQDLTGLNCLDLFAGTGVMGFEALSRNAKSTVLVEKTPVVYKAILENKTTLQASNAQVLNADALSFIAKNQQLFDVVFLDPPYNQGWLDKVLPLLPAHLTKDALVYVEAEYAIKPTDAWQVVKQSKAGNVFYHLLKSAHD
ncbi:MAG: 16S rRNA (guanine(966)-N(2))-methyltransferase RsmD [Methylotenera sp.]|nr:16S rRNA (guanine(966)-N(2))-methyltransferase RsmD [Methylotenera sp.]MDP2101785.1 16S rRNA (guanine(966)-N(2))-methyltransferase RsmD [Methylotenera sp.]MDP2281417.1 16S rRNA (guanine(966)-N(2))-methyltransferase RsmD [Methylotenera sp.]MDP2403448.1 16S rRNA (guanine(966)-N(2))-methyltransferase RsmD [Methylotenera sp.]MDP3060245.1 16S rRNA (guanine(966)-N(2))-methyltransferase RsmD [Methylotenera sp.]